MLDLIKILLPYRALSLEKLKEEQLICVQFANYLRQLTLEQKFSYVWFHIPNEFLPSRQKNWSFDLKQKHMGKISGVPDYCFIGKNSSFFIEVKTSKGKQSESQTIFERWCEHNEIKYYICRSLAECVETVSLYLEPVS